MHPHKNFSNMPNRTRKQNPQIERQKRLWIIKTTPNRMNIAGGIQLLDFQLYY